MNSYKFSVIFRHFVFRHFGLQDQTVAPNSHLNCGTFFVVVTVCCRMNI
jgi:hypothetical protein